LHQYVERLKKTTETSIARLNIRDVAEKALLATKSEPSELTGEFKEENDYISVINHNEKGIANNTRTCQRSLWKEPYFWPIDPATRENDWTASYPAGPQNVNHCAGKACRTRYVPRQYFQVVIVLGTPLRTSPQKCDISTSLPFQ
jgi:hypothetical protein